VHQVIKKSEKYLEEMGEKNPHLPLGLQITTNALTCLKPVGQ
jgi:hypothetical protein